LSEKREINMLIGRIIRRKGVTLSSFLGVCFILFANLLFCAEIKQDTVIAEVDGQKIIYKQIMQNPEQIIFSYQLEHKREPSKEEISNIILKKEKEQLAAEIHHIIKQKKIKEFGIKVSNREMQLKMKSFYVEHNLDPKEIADEINRCGFALAKALREALENPAEEKKIYEQELSSLMTYEEWTGHRRCYNTIEKIGWIEKSLPQTAEDLYKPNPAIEAWLLGEKFRDRITKDVSVTAEELRDYYNIVYEGVESKPTFAEVKKQLEKELLKGKKQRREKEWWQEQYKKAKIEIKDERFKDVIDMLLPFEERELE